MAASDYSHIADALERMNAMFENMQQRQVEAQPQKVPAPDEFKGISDFRKCDPPKFGGGHHPDEAQNDKIEFIS